MPQAIVYESVAKRDLLSQEINAMERQARRMDSEIEAGLVDAQSFSHERITDKRGFMQRLANKKKRLALITPPSIKELVDKGVEEKKLRARAAQLAEVIVKGAGRFPRMRSREEMEQGPAGADDMNKLHHRMIAHHNITLDGELVAIDHAKSQYPMYAEFKNICRIINKDSEEEMDSSVANLEMLRLDRCDDKDTLMNFQQRTYANPASRLTAQQWEDRIGIDNLNPLQLAIHNMEKEGPLRAPTMQDHWARMYGKSEEKEPEQAKENGENTPSGDAPMHVGGRKWILGNGDTFMGSREAAVVEWERIKAEEK